MIIKKRDWKAHPTDAAVIEVDPQVSTETYSEYCGIGASVRFAVEVEK